MKNFLFIMAIAMLDVVSCGERSHGRIWNDSVDTADTDDRFVESEIEAAETGAADEAAK